MPDIDITDHTEGEWKRAFELFNAFDVDAGLDDIAAMIGHIPKGPGFDRKVGAVGYCLGAQRADLTATSTDVDACVSYYGVALETRVAEAEKRTHPLLMNIAEQHQFVPKGCAGGHFSRAQRSPNGRNLHPSQLPPRLRTRRR